LSQGRDSWVSCEHNDEPLRFQKRQCIVDQMGSSAFSFSRRAVLSGEFERERCKGEKLGEKDCDSVLPFL